MGVVKPPLTRRSRCDRWGERVPGRPLRQADTDALCHRLYPPPACANHFFFRIQPTTPGVALPLPSACAGGPPIMRVTGMLLFRRSPGRPRAARPPAASGRPRRRPGHGCPWLIPPRPIPAIDRPGGSGSARRRITGTQFNGDVMDHAILSAGCLSPVINVAGCCSGIAGPHGGQAAIGGRFFPAFPPSGSSPATHGMPPGGRLAWLAPRPLAGCHGRWAGPSPCSGAAVPPGHGLGQRTHNGAVDAIDAVASCPGCRACPAIVPFSII